MPADMNAFCGDTAVDTHAPARLPWPLLVAMALLPAVQTMTAVYFEIAPGWTYPLLKLAMIVVPILLWRARRSSFRSVAAALGLRRPTWRGPALGAAMAGVIVGGYAWVLAGRIDGAAIVEKVESLGIQEHFLAVTLVTSLWNSLFEEYYWRGFLLSEARSWRLSPAALTLLGGALFGLHHVFALAPLFSGPLVIFFTFATMVAGGVWTAMRLRGVSILDGYISHVCADLAIMGIGWTLMTSV